MLGSVHRGEDGPHHLFEKTSKDLEGIDRVALRRPIDARLQSSGIHDIDPAREQLCDGPFDRNEVEHGKAIRVIDLDQDVEIAIGPPFAARYGAKNRGSPNASRPQHGPMAAQNSQCIVSVDHRRIISCRARPAILFSGPRLPSRAGFAIPT
jgi:hypothetical protein